MPYPIGHALVGLTIAKKTRVNPFLAVILANLSDIDYSFGIPAGNLLRYHEDLYTHTFLFAGAAALIVFLYAKRTKRAFSILQFLGVFIILCSHVIMDLFFKFPLPYRINLTQGMHGFWDFIFTFILNPDFLYNNLLDLIFYGAFYIILVKFIFREKLV